MNNEKEKVVEISSYKLECPICKQELDVKDYKYNIPHYGDILITSGKCRNCQYTLRDVMVLTEREPRKIIYRVEDSRDMNALVVKSSSCIITIPELDVEIKPGLYSQGYITTIEGVIVDLMEILDKMCSEEGVNKENCEKTRILLEKAKKAEISYTIIIHDHMGICDIISSYKKPIYEKIDKVSYDSQ
ncbi:MAG: ZPR1 zinc finger domain-containing protein [Desulfurococcaceae archaeon]